MNLSVSFIGGGRITRILLQAFKNKGVVFNSTVVYDTNPDVLAKLKRQFPDIQIPEEPGLNSVQDIVFIALHPPVIMETLEKIKDNISDKTIVISLAPKITIRKFQEKLKTGKIVRMIPNATSFINEGYNPVSFEEGITLDEKSDLFGLLDSLGKTFEVKEPALESYAVISAMLPTYFWFQWQKLEEIGQQTGLAENEAKEAIRDTLHAAINLFFNPNLNEEDVMDLIPVKPIAEHESSIKGYFADKLIPLFDKIKP